MPETLLRSTPSPRTRQLALLAGLTLAVLLGHWAILSDSRWLRTSSAEPSASVNRAFTTRTITLTAPDSPKPPPTARPVRPKSAPPGGAPAQAKANAPIREFFPEPVAPDRSHPTPEPEGDEAEPEPAPALAADKAIAVRNFAIAGSVRLKYDIKGEIKGFPYFANGELLWLQDGKTYDARLEISHFLLGARVQTSKGLLTTEGLEPIRFGDKVRSEVAAHFERNKNIVSFSANTPNAALEPGAQDQLSVFLQLGAMLGGSPEQFARGTNIPFQAVGPRSSESWVFQVGDDNALTLPGGLVNVIQLTREPTGENDTKVEVWLAPAMDYLPVRIRLSQNNGDFVEQQWRSTQKP